MITTNFIDEKIQGNEATIRALQAEITELESQKATQKDGIESWLGFQFESSSGLTEEFATFYQDMKGYLKKELESDFELVNVSRGHFEISGFVKNKVTGKYAYLSMSDVRYWQDEWYEHILVRTAEHDKDYTGGSNDYTNLVKLKEHLLLLTKD